MPSNSSYSLKELAALVAARLVGDPERQIQGVNTLEEATVSDLSFLANPRYQEAMKQSHAGAICVHEKTPLPEGKDFLVCENPSAAFQMIAEKLLNPVNRSGFQGIHPTALIHPTAKLGTQLTVGPYAVIDAGAIIGDHTTIGPHVSIGFDVEIGTHCYLHPQVVVRERCLLGNRVILQPGAVIGSCGFGYTQDREGRFLKLEQLGIVVLEDDVEIGANTTIDRSRFKTTLIQEGSKIDNLCQIAHNVKVGKHNAIAAQTGIAGSAKTGNHVMMGGQVGVLGHVEIDDRVMIATRGGVSKSLKSGKYGGSPGVPLTEYNRREVHVRRLEEYLERIKALEGRCSQLETPFK